MVETAHRERIGFQLFGGQLGAAYLARSVSPLIQSPQGVVDRPQLGAHLVEQGCVGDRRVVGRDRRLFGRRDGYVGHV